MFADSYLSPISSSPSLNYKIPEDQLSSLAYYSAFYINKNSLELGQYEALKKDSIDLYILLKTFYEEKRIQEIKE